MEFAHAGKGIEGSEEVVSNVHCGHTGRIPWEQTQRTLSQSMTALTIKKHCKEKQ